MNRKIVTLLCLLVFISCMGNRLFAQKFYPMNFVHLYTDEGISKNEVAILNPIYLPAAGFERINDTLYINKQNKEQVMLSTRKDDDKNEVLLTYRTVADLKIFKERLQEYQPKLEQTDAHTYQATFKNPLIQFIIMEDTVINNKRFRDIKFLLRYDKGQKFSFSSDNCAFPITATYPFQNTTWYFSAKYERSSSSSEYNDMRLILSREKTAYKIEFVDDIHFKVTYTDPKKKAHIYQSRYNNYKSEINFYANSFEWADKDNMGRALETMPEKYAGSDSFFGDPKNFARAAGSARYFRFIFSKSYRCLYHIDGGVMELKTQDFKEQKDVKMMPESMPKRVDN
ncbi:hypothetical protein [Sphingobacterium sp.]|uniref:hypothetical protein n=1 Tax=Sphingobacterium sp. TaxID=341027 RepID=UPI0031E45157